MSWDRSRPNGKAASAKYATPEHRRDVANAKAALQRAGSGRCAEIVCVMRTRLILPGMDLHLCHERRSGAVLGLGHADCNRREASRYARSRQNPPAASTPLRW